MSLSRFAELIERPDAELDEISLSVAGALHGPVDEIEWLAELDQLAGECPTPTPDGVVRHLVETVGLSGNQEDYYDWRNSCLDEVLRRRIGIPITLAVTTIEVARRLGVRLDGVGMPGHFLVGDGTDSGVFYDPFHGPDPLGLSDVKDLFDDMSGGRTPWEDRFAAPVPKHAIVDRLLANLWGIFTARQDRVRVAIVAEMRRHLRTPAPDGPAAVAVLN